PGVPAPASTRSLPPITAGLALTLFPAGVAPNFASARVAVPLSKAIAIVPHIGGGYLPVPADDVAPILGGGIRFAPAPRWTIEPSGLYARFPKFVAWYQGALRVEADFGPSQNGPPVVKGTLSSSVTRWLWRPELGAPGSEVIEGYAQLEAQ